MDWRGALAEQGLKADDAVDIAETLLALSAADDPGRDLAAARAELAKLAEPLPGSPSAAALSDRIAADHGYEGDSETYDDMRNADIAEVVRRRRGLPVALGLLYIHCGRAQGWSIEGLNFPGHFLLRLNRDASPELIDPFSRGAVVTPSDMGQLLSRVAGPGARLQPGHMAGVPVRHVLMRLQNNIKIRALQAGDTDRAVAVLERIGLFAPAEAAVWLELAGIESGRGNMKRALALLDEAAGHAVDEVSRVAIADARQALGRRLN